MTTVKYARIRATSYKDGQCHAIYSHTNDKQKRDLKSKIAHAKKDTKTSISVCHRIVNSVLQTLEIMSLRISL